MELYYNDYNECTPLKSNGIVKLIEDVKEAALMRLDMHYASSDQIEYYTLDQDSYVRQYKDVELAQ